MGNDACSDGKHRAIPVTNASEQRSLTVRSEADLGETIRQA